MPKIRFMDIFYYKDQSHRCFDGLLQLEVPNFSMWLHAFRIGRVTECRN